MQRLGIEEASLVKHGTQTEKKDDKAPNKKVRK
jgi:hypothetical protein